MMIAFRVDSSLEIGSGHVLRCLTLANQLKEIGHEVSFICRDLPGNLIDYVEVQGFQVYGLRNGNKQNGCKVEEHLTHSSWLDVSWKDDVKETIIRLQQIGNDIDWLIADHYAIDIHWEKEVRPYVKKIMIIDDLADRSHDCDLLLDQNLYENMELRYKGLVADSCTLLLGPQYVLLRPEFRQAREHIRPYNGEVKRIFVFFGGSDPTNETMKAFETIKQIDCPDITVDVVVGQSNPYREKVKEICASRKNTNYYCQIPYLAELMVNADLAIGAGGVTMWERCFLGLPSIVVAVAKNQEESVKAAAAKEVIWNLGWYESISKTMLANAIIKMLNNSMILTEMSNKARSLMASALGTATHPVIDHLLEESLFET